MDKNKWAKVLLLFLVTYAMLYLLALYTPMEDWFIGKDLFNVDYMYVLIPVPGFFFMYLLIKPFNKYFSTNFASSPLFPLAFLAISAVAYYVSLYWYHMNISEMAGRPVPFDYWQILTNSAFLVFILAALAGWVSHAVIERPGK